MEQGIIPWQKPWVAAGKAVSYATGKPYSLLNQMLLGQPGEYATFKQVQQAGGCVRKGEKAHMVVFWKWVEQEDEETGEKKYTEIESGQQATMGGMISAYKKLQTKSGSSMAFVTVEDMYGTVECVCFPKTYDKIRGFLQADKVVSLSGKIDISEEKAPVIIVDKMTEFVPPEEKTAETVKPAANGQGNPAGGAGRARMEEKDDDEKTLWLNVTGLDKLDLDELTDTLTFYAGNTSVIFVDTQKRAKYMCSQKVALSRALFAELATCLTEDKIKLL